MIRAAADPIIDADAHVVESEHTWDYLDPSDRQYRPQPLESREDAGVKLQFWLIDGKVRGFRFPAFSADCRSIRRCNTSGTRSGASSYECY